MTAKTKPRVIHLCKGCIEDLEAYNPYVVPIRIVKVDTIEECDNYKLTQPDPHEGVARQPISDNQ